MKNKVHVGYRIVSDDDGHEYVIPADAIEDWYNWDWEAHDWELPEWADPINGPTNKVIFDYYFVEGRDDEPSTI